MMSSRLLVILLLALCTPAMAQEITNVAGQQILNNSESHGRASSNSRAGANAGASASSGGNTLSVSTGGTSSSGGTAESTGGNAVISIDASDNFDSPSAGAAGLNIGYCQTGATGQVQGGGFSIGGSDALCDYIRMADRALLAAQQAKADGDADKYALYMSEYHEALDKAIELTDRTEITALINRVATQLGFPLAIVLALVLL